MDEVLAHPFFSAHNLYAQNLLTEALTHKDCGCFFTRKEQYERCTTNQEGRPQRKEELYQRIESGKLSGVERAEAAQMAHKLEKQLRSEGNAGGAGYLSGLAAMLDISVMWQTEIRRQTLDVIFSYQSTQGVCLAVCLALLFCLNDQSCRDPI